MFLEFWQLGVLLVVFFLGLRNMYSTGKKEGFANGAEVAVDYTLLILQREKIIEINDFDEIRGLQDPKNMS